MSTTMTTFGLAEMSQGQLDDGLAAAITRAASKQSYYTIRCLVDRDRVQDALRAYAYFRWMDDQVDERGMDLLERLLFVERQKALLERCNHGEIPTNLADQEWMLVDLIRSQRPDSAGLQAYLQHMMAVMAFDAGRRGRLISEAELSAYTHHLAVGVTEALHHFIGHGSRSPAGASRYAAVSGAHLTHMLRDTLEDVQAGYFNIPREFLEAHRIAPADFTAPAYLEWVRKRASSARALFRVGVATLGQVENLRCRLAGSAYIARFLIVLDCIHRDAYLLRPSYPERRGWKGGMRLCGLVLSQAVHYHLSRTQHWLGTD